VDWTPTLIRMYFVSLQQTVSARGKARSPHTVASYAISIRAFCHWLHREELIATDIVARVKVPKAPILAKPTLASEDLQRLLDAAKDSRTAVRDVALLLLALDTGLRCAELASLRAEDIFWPERTAKVMGKGGRERFVVFSPPTAKAMQRYGLKGRSEEETAFFQTEEGQALTTSGVYQLCRRIGKRAGIHLNPHKLRHSFVTLSLRNGASPFLVQAQCGHRTLQTTLRYTHLLTEDLAKAHEAISPVASSLGRTSRSKG
jgi:site-specific recombinase XerD